MGVRDTTKIRRLQRRSDTAKTTKDVGMLCYTYFYLNNNNKKKIENIFFLVFLKYSGK